MTGCKDLMEEKVPDYHVSGEGYEVRYGNVDYLYIQIIPNGKTEYPYVQITFDTTEDGLRNKFATENLSLWYYFVLPEKIKEKLQEIEKEKNVNNQNVNNLSIDDLYTTLQLELDNQDALKQITKTVSGNAIPNGWIYYDPSKPKKIDDSGIFIQCLKPKDLNDTGE